MNFYNIPIHEKSPNIVNAIIEIEKGSSAKYEYDNEYDAFRFDRSLSSAMVYPANYGFIPNTMADDGDPLDILTFNHLPIQRGTLVEVQVLGVLDMWDGGERDYKILGVPTCSVKRFRNLHDIDNIFLRITRNFFNHYKDLISTNVNVGEWEGKNAAYKIIKDNIIKK